MDEHGYIRIGEAVREVNQIGERVAIPDKKLKRLLPGGGKQGARGAPSPALAAICEDIGVDYRALRAVADELAVGQAQQLFQALDGEPGEGFVALSWELAAATFRSVQELTFAYGAKWALRERERAEEAELERQADAYMERGQPGGKA